MKFLDIRNKIEKGRKRKKTVERTIQNLQLFK